MKASASANSIPLAIKIFAGIVALMGLMFSFTGYFNPAQLSPGASWDQPATLLASATIGSMGLGLSVGLLLAILSNRPQSMALILIMRSLMAVQDLAIAIVLGLGPVLIVFQSLVSLLGILSVVKLFRIIRADSSHAH